MGRWDLLYATHDGIFDTLAIFLRVVEHQVKSFCDSELGAGYIGMTKVYIA